MINIHNPHVSRQAYWNTKINPLKRPRISTTYITIMSWARIHGLVPYSVLGAWRMIILCLIEPRSHRRIDAGRCHSLRRTIRTDRCRCCRNVSKIFFTPSARNVQSLVALAIFQAGKPISGRRFWTDWMAMDSPFERYVFSDSSYISTYGIPLLFFSCCWSHVVYECHANI